MATRMQFGMIEKLQAMKFIGEKYLKHMFKAEDNDEKEKPKLSTKDS